MNKSKFQWFIGIFFLLILLAGAIIFLPNLRKSIYPIKYEEYVTKYSNEYSVPEPLIYAVIKTESNFDENAESRVGAKGLMQLMPDTFDWIDSKIGEGQEQITDPETNIKYGTYLLSWLYDYFGDWDTAIAAYNAGHGRVGNWLEDSRYSQDGKTLNEIPLSETKNYVNKVNKTKKQYEEIYFNGD